MNAGNVVLSLIGILIGIGIFLLLRQVFCWFNKINERIELHQETNELLKKILEHQAGNNRVIEENTPPSNYPETTN